jgi:hypothetical protein
VPAKKRIGRDDGGDLSETTSAQLLRLPGKLAALCVGEPDTLTAELLTKNAVLLLEILDRLLLVAAQPAGQQNDEILQRQRRHRHTLARSGRAKIVCDWCVRQMLNLLNLLAKIMGGVLAHYGVQSESEPPNLATRDRCSSACDKQR